MTHLALRRKKNLGWLAFILGMNAEVFTLALIKPRILTIGIAPYEAIKKRTVAIARGELKIGPSDPKVWFTSMESFAQVLSTNNQMLLGIIARSSPSSIEELSELSGRAKSNLSRTLHMMERYGLVKLKRGERGRIVPRVLFNQFRVSVKLAGNVS